MTTQVLRKPVFSWKKAIQPITNFFRSIYDAMVEARRLQAAMQLANILKAQNRDFKDWSHGELVNAILSEKPIGMDKRPL
jgi:predicted ATPase